MENLPKSSLEEMLDIIELIKSTPNDQELGEKIREYGIKNLDVYKKKGTK